MLLALGDLIEGRLGNINVAAFNQLPHLAEKEGQQQGTDVRAIHIPVGHNDNLVISQGINMVFFVTDTRSQSRNHGSDLVTGYHLVESGLFNIQDLALEG